MPLADIGASFVAGLAGVLQAYGRVSPNGIQVRLAWKPVAQPPKLRTVGPNLKGQAVAPVCEAIGLVGELCGNLGDGV
jgi:hypothetical protein